MEIQIIYTPNAHYFIPHIFPTLVDRIPGNPVLQQLRSNYASLRERYNRVPQTVGVVTVDDIFKKQAQGYRDEVAGSSLANVTGSYLPLDLFEACVNPDRRVGDGLQNEYNHRTLMWLLSQAPLTLDESLTLDQKKVLTIGSAIPISNKVEAYFLENSSQVREKSELLADAFDEGARLVRETFPQWKNIDKLYATLLERFKANQVSREFPLVFIPPGRGFIFMYSVSLKDQIYEPPIDEKLLKYIKIGCESIGLDKIPNEIMDKLAIGNRDLFGESELMLNLGDLLGKLPEPKTIITDLYIVDHFPEIQRMGFKSSEFELEP